MMARSPKPRSTTAVGALAGLLPCRPLPCPPELNHGVCNAQWCQRVVLRHDHMPIPAPLCAGSGPSPTTRGTCCNLKGGTCGTGSPDGIRGDASVVMVATRVAGIYPAAILLL